MKKKYVQDKNERRICTKVRRSEIKNENKKKKIKMVEVRMVRMAIKMSGRSVKTILAKDVPSIQTMPGRVNND